jgi:uncharacterized protein (DUF983 family)
MANAAQPNPAPSLDPLRGHTPAGKFRTLLRGATGHCAVCGNRLVSMRWTTLPETCSNCGIKLERKEGQFVGAVGINTILSFGVMLFVLLGGIALTAPDIAVGPMVATTALAALIAPLILLPISKTIWNAIDLIMIPVEPGEAPGLEAQLAEKK